MKGNNTSSSWDDYLYNSTLIFVCMASFSVNHQITNTNVYIFESLNIPEHNIGLCFNKLISLRTIFTLIGSCAAYLIFNFTSYLPKHVAFASLWIMSIFRMGIFLIIELSNVLAPDVFFFLFVESFFFGIFQISFFATYSEFIPQLNVTVDVSRVVFSLSQLFLNWIFRGDSYSIVEVQTFVCGSLTIISCFLFLQPALGDEDTTPQYYGDYIIRARENLDMLETDVEVMKSKEIGLVDIEYKLELVRLLENIKQLNDEITGLKIFSGLSDLIEEEGMKNFLEKYNMIKSIITGEKYSEEQESEKHNIWDRGIEYLFNDKISEMREDLNEMEVRLEKNEKNIFIVKGLKIENETFKISLMTHLKNTFSTFVMYIPASILKNFVYPQIIPFAFLDAEYVYHINYYVPLVYILGSSIVFWVDFHFPSFRRWDPVYNVFWILIFPMILIFLYSMSAIHTRFPASRVIINSKSRVLLLTLLFMLSFSIMKSMSYAGVANYVIIRSNDVKGSTDVLILHNIIATVCRYVSLKLSIGYNQTRVSFGYIFPHFNPANNMGYRHDFIFWITNTISRAINDFKSDLSFNVRSYL